MIDSILAGILNFLANAIDVLLTPINNLIANNFPDVQTGITNIISFMNTCVSSIGWVISAIGLEQATLALVLTTLSFRLLIQPTVHLIKFIIKWYKTIVP